MKSYYCQHCDKSINHIFKRRHNKSKTHLYMYYNIVINKYNNGDVLWKDFENIIRDYINDYNNKFNTFSIKVDFKLDNEDFSISIDNIEGEIPLYKLHNIGWIYYKFCQSKKAKDFVYHNAILKNIKLESSYIINNFKLTIFSKYKSIKRRHLLSQPRSVLETHILKNIHNKDICDKLTKYYFLSKKYNIIF